MKRRYLRIFNTFFILSFILFQSGCLPSKVIRSLSKPSQVGTSNLSKDAIKVHMKDGGLFVLSSYIVISSNDSIIGNGEYYNSNRNKANPPKQIDTKTLNGQSSFKISFSDIALFETNKITGLSGKLIGMGLVGVTSAITSTYCLINPKACFGSCPTFYAWNGEKMQLMAEGFSSSILKAYEKSDIDMLYWSKINGKDFQLKLTNEALETHVIRYADLLVFPKRTQERVFATEEGQFYKTDKILSPNICKGPEGDCRDLVLKMDAKERFSVSDEKNLAAKEFIELEFNTASKSQLGLIIGCRQTLLTTYLFYQSLANLGNSAGYFASRIESGDQSLKRKVDRIWNILGGIEVYVQGKNRNWIKAGEIEEMGPIASDVHLLKLPVQESEITKIRLKMTKGLWRIDYVGLTEMKEQVHPIQINPTVVISNDSIDSKALTQLCDSDNPLITLPGDSYTLHYTLPSTNDDYEIFLKTKGYYLEWMREEWIAEQNLKNAGLMFVMPKLYLKLVADKFKVVEPTMEEKFWRSRYVKN